MQRSHEEDLGQNAFLRALRVNYEGLYKRAAEKAENTIILMPCADSLHSEHISQAFAECHILQVAYIPGNYMNLLGQGVEINDDVVQTSFGFQEQRICTVIQRESMYDFGNSFTVLVLDKPLTGKWRIRQSGMDRPGLKTNDVPFQPCDWLNTAPNIDAELWQEVHGFRKTFVRVRGCEQQMAERMHSICSETALKLIQHHQVKKEAQQREIASAVSRAVYCVLHSFIFPHLVKELTPFEAKLVSVIKSFASPAEVLEEIPGASNKGLSKVDVSRSSVRLANLDSLIAPHEKVGCVVETYNLLQACVAEEMQKARRKDAVEITGDDVLSLFIEAIVGSGLQYFLPHAAHMDMYLHGSAGLSPVHDEAGYAVSAFQAALSFLLEERKKTRSTNTSRPVRAGPGSGPSIASYLQGAVDEDDSQLENLVRQAKAQR